MSARRLSLWALTLCCAIAALLPTAASAAPLPGWSINLSPMPANFTPGEAGEYLAIATNVGEGTASAPASQLSLEVPAGLVIEDIRAVNIDPESTENPVCAEAGQTVTCTTTEPVKAGRWLLLQVNVSVPSLTPEGTLSAKASVGGGGAIETASAIAPTAIQEEPIPFGFLEGFVAPASSEEGTPETTAGGHPFQQVASFGFPTKNPGDGLTNDGHPRNFFIGLPRGFSGNELATKTLCTEAELTSADSCPDEAQVGIADVTTLLGEAGVNVVLSSPLYNMVPPPGVAAELATDVAFAGIYVHAQASVRTDDEYRIEAAVRDSLAFGRQPIFNLQSQAWGLPSATSHDGIRGECRDGGGLCTVPVREIAFLTMPADCPGALSYGARADSWEEPSPPFDQVGADYQSVYAAGHPGHAEGDPVQLEDCAGQAFEPEIGVQPTTTLSDSPSGLDFELLQSQQLDYEDRYSAPLRDLTATFPAGLAVNPSQAAGLGACSEEQIGFAGPGEEGGLVFSGFPQRCPDAAKIATATVTSPLLAERNDEHEVEETPEGEPILKPLHGSLYIAQPFDNPFDSLIATYLVIEDRDTGILAKIAGKGELDPDTGQITVRFSQNPELPLARAAVHLFGGERGSLTTPPTCGPHTTTSVLTPWSEGPDAFPSDSFQLAGAPGGGPCPNAESQLPHAPSFDAGTLSPQAGAFSPLLVKLARADGSQRWRQIETTLPTGLSARLAGVGSCSDAEIAKAHSREEPEQGAAELANPSCPASSEIGTLVASAGSGPRPYFTEGRLYLAGPYKGAPLSAVAIVPAVAGPFDLGTVVVRSALHLDPVTAQARILSDPFPAVVQGVPVDLRSAAIKVGRPNFSLNPTSCDEKAFAGALTSTLGATAPLTERFQVGGCGSLPYKPKLRAWLYGKTNRGAHPRFKAVLTAKPGEANTAAFSVTLPRSEFIDQAHFRTICTRVQYAANQCPPGSIYGHVKAYSPLVDYAFEGPIYLRSSSHKLPDAVAALRGPAHQPIAIDAVARIDSVKGRLRSRVQTVPDAPISRVVVSLQGGRKGLFQNSTNICKGKHRIAASFTGQNGKAHDISPLLKPQCKGKKGGKKGKGKGGSSKGR